MTWLWGIFFFLLAAGMLEVLCRSVIRRIRRAPNTPRLKVRYSLHAGISEKLPACAVNSFDSRGLRRARADRETKGGERRILLTGGSVVECAFLNDWETIGANLERTLNAHGSDSLGVCRVVTAAKSGWRFHEVRRFLMSLDHDDRWDSIVIHCGASDLLRWASLGGGSLRESEESPPDSDIFAQYPDSDFNSVRELGTLRCLRLLKSFLFRFRTVQNVGERIIRMRACRTRATFTDGLPGFADVVAFSAKEARECFRLAKALSSKVYFIPQIPVYGNAVDLKSIEHLLWCGAVGDRMNKAPDTFLSPTAIARLLRELNSEVMRIATTEEVEVSSVIEGIPINSETYYDDFHLTARGAVHFSEGIARSIVGRHVPRS